MFGDEVFLLSGPDDLDYHADGVSGTMDLELLGQLRDYPA
jgi:hypothetical protein